ncbi:unnamed protein product [Peniophora sp. CBMAI 1063]|nr:unnamed protein product [Peniophora sp. CBMAI 1063]
MSISALRKVISTPYDFSDIIPRVNLFFTLLGDMIRDYLGDAFYAECEGFIAEEKSNIIAKVALVQQKHHGAMTQVELFRRKLDEVEGEVNLLQAERTFTEDQVAALTVRLEDLLEQNDPKLRHVTHAIAECAAEYGELDERIKESQDSGSAALQSFNDHMQSINGDVEELEDSEKALTRTVAASFESIARRFEELMRRVAAVQ